MGDQKIITADEGAKLRDFMKLLLQDLRALEKMLAAGMIEKGVRRIGAEQEMFLVDQSWAPATGALSVLERLKGDPRFTTELGMFNLELNLDPTALDGEALTRLETQLNQRLLQARTVAQEI